MLIKVTETNDKPLSATNDTSFTEKFSPFGMTRTPFPVGY